ncbi:hypothetical protein SPTER_28030 [Sporomusa termitida]|uniref:Uncharacterized protein n=1 Tax=Sporomusa termitida TaxID=2377 RepID=A0A517DVS4_9FIRM|nr:hypothetical protein SPTER_28030 [Sporomusa termitida]
MHRKNNGIQNPVNGKESDTLPDSQDARTPLAAQYGRDEIAQIITRILSIAKEICCLSERKIPIEARPVASGSKASEYTYDRSRG